MRNVYCALLALLAMAWLSVGCAAAVTPSASPAASPASIAGQAKSGWQERWDKTVAEAKKEGQGVVYTIAGPPVRTALAQAFQQKYGIELQFIAGITAEIASKLITERERGVKSADAIIVGGGTLLSVLKPRDTIAPLEPFLILPEVTDARVWNGEMLFHDKDKTGVGFLSYYLRYLFRNTDMVKEEDITSYADLLKPQWKGKIIMEDPTITGSTLSWSAGLVRAWGFERTKDYLLQLAKQEPVISRDARYIHEVVSRGKYPIGFSARAEIVVEFQGVGAPISYVNVKELSKMAPATGVISLPSQPAHPNSATVFVNWLLSREGQIIASKAWGQPSARTDIPREGFHPTFYPAADEKYFVQDEEDYLTQGKMIEANKEIFGPLMK